MAQNKKSVWSVIILVCTILTLILLVTSIVVTVVGLPDALAVAKQAAIDGGATEEEAKLAASIALGAVLAALVVASIFDVFQVVGGFLFSLKGRWGVFCIVVAALSIGSGLWGLISAISNHVGTVSMVTSAVGLAVSVLFGVACVMHLIENRKAA